MNIVASDTAALVVQDAAQLPVIGHQAFDILAIPLTDQAMGAAIEIASFMIETDYHSFQQRPQSYLVIPTKYW